MNRFEFIYWLQGFFEIREHKNLLTKRQVDMIQRHMLLLKSDVPEALKNDSWPIAVYLGWLKNALSTIQKSNYTDARTMADIEIKLKEQFKNVTAEAQYVKALTAEDNPFLPPEEYEPLGDIYNTQRLC